MIGRTTPTGHFNTKGKPLVKKGCVFENMSLRGNSAKSKSENDLPNDFEPRTTASLRSVCMNRAHIRAALQPD